MAVGVWARGAASCRQVARTAARGALVLGSLVACAGCASRLLIGERGAPGDAGAPRDDCARQGPLWPVGDGPAVACTAPGAPPPAFRYALCACGDVATEETLTVDGFDSSGQGAPASLAGAGSVGVGGQLTATTPISLGGSLIVDGDTPLHVDAPLSVGGNLRSNGSLTGEASVFVGGDARVDGDVRVASLAVVGGLTVEEDAVVEVSDSSTLQITRAPLDERYAPCDCGAPLDLAAAIARAAQDNDNAALGLAADGLSTLDAAAQRTLPCGRYYVDRLLVRFPLTLTIQGSVALFIAGELTTEPGGALEVRLEGDGQLDLVLGGEVSVNDRFSLGGPAQATRARLYAAGANLFINGPTDLAAALYAPRTTLSAMDTLQLYGAALVGKWFSNRPAELHHDLALARADCGQAACDARALCAPDLRCVGALCLP